VHRAPPVGGPSQQSTRRTLPCPRVGRAAPPDDIGGVWRYSSLVAAAGDKADPERAEAAAELAEWGMHAPARFEVDAVTRALKPLARVVAVGADAGRDQPAAARPAGRRSPARVGGTVAMW
jgi:hypothetical protein